VPNKNSKALSVQPISEDELCYNNPGTMPGDEKPLHESINKFVQMGQQFSWFTVALCLAL
jgi:hypothetical protein